MKDMTLPPGVVWLVHYSRRPESPTNDHGVDYKNLQTAVHAGHITKIQRGKRLAVIKDEADRYLESLKVKSTTDAKHREKDGVAIESRLRALENKFTELCSQLGCAVP